MNTEDLPRVERLVTGHTEGGCNCCRHGSEFRVLFGTPGGNMATALRLCYQCIVKLQRAIQRA